MSDRHRIPRDDEYVLAVDDDDGANIEHPVRITNRPAAPPHQLRFRVTNLGPFYSFTSTWTLHGRWAFLKALFTGELPTRISIEVRQ